MSNTRIAINKVLSFVFPVGDVPRRLKRRQRLFQQNLRASTKVFER